MMGNEAGTLKLRLRHCAEGVHGFQTDTWTLFHPNSALDEHGTFGDRPRSLPPPGVDTRLRGDEGWLKKGLRLFGAAQSGKPTLQGHPLRKKTTRNLATKPALTYSPKNTGPAPVRGTGGL